MEYPSTPKQFNLFQEYKSIEHDGNMLTADQRTRVYEDRSKVIAEMADAFYIFSRSIFFNPGMVEQYNLSCDKYINYFTQILCNIDIFLQEDQLMCTKVGFSLVPVPGYLPNGNDLEQTNANQIIQTANEEVTSTNREMQVIVQDDKKHPHINKSGSFSRLKSFKLNDMGFSLNKISPIKFDVKNPQTPADHGIKGRAPTSTPRERRVPQSTQQEQAHNEVADLNEAHHKPRGNASYNPDESVTNKHVQGYDSYHPRQAICLLSHSNNTSHHLRKAAKKIPSSTDQDTKKSEVLRIILQAQQTVCHKDQPLQHLHHKLDDHHKLPQSAITTKTTRIHWNTMEPPMDPPEHL